MRNLDSLNDRERADAVVIGGGVIGLSVARALAQRGLRVTLIERARLGAEASFAAAGMLAAQAEANRADSFLDLACAGRDLYPAFADALREETGIYIELERTGTLYLAFTEEDEEEIERRYQWQTRAGLQVERLTGDEARLLEPCISPLVRRALRFPLDVQVENRRLLAALAASLEKYKVLVHTGTYARRLRIEGGRVTGVETTRGDVSAPILIVASGAWTSFIAFEGKRLPPIRIEPVRGQMLCFEANPRPARHVIYSPRGYIVPRLDGRLLAGSTTENAGFEKRVTGGGIHTISRHALEIAPLINDLPLLDAWAGLRPCAEDELPVIGACAEVRGLYYATGHYRNGILLAPITGELLAEEITGGAVSPLLNAFSPARFQYAGVG
ncbi:MAG TPA: glycine oxidase ThiO [Pyrinomonadaceae bacterium]|nr:glycine oxidase ThiO [Pyrinomonadaceae bacterium]